MKKTIIALFMVLLASGCASSPNQNRSYYDDGGAALMDYSARMLGGGGGYGYGYSQPARMQTQCIQQGPWLNCW